MSPITDRGGGLSFCLGSVDSGLRTGKRDFDISLMGV
jgi:hypothetical protein